MIILDASVLIAYLDREATHHQRANLLLAREIDDDFGANSLTLAETLVAPARQDQLDVAREALTAIEVREIPFPPDTAIRLAQLRASTKLKMPDCCVLLAAEAEQARVASFDRRLIEAAALRHLSTAGWD